MEKDKSLLDRIKSITSNQGIEPDRLSRLNALLYRVVTSEGVVSYDINDVALIFSENNALEFVELIQRDESTDEILTRIIEALYSHLNDSTTKSVHLHVFVSKDFYYDVINSLGKLILNGSDVSMGVWYYDIPKIEAMLIISKKYSTYESNLHR